MNKIQLTAEEKLAKQQYYREYYKRPGNEGKRALYQKRYWGKKAITMKENKQ